MVRESFLERSIGALLVVALTLPFWGLLLSMGGHPTVVELSYWGYLLICMATIAAAVSTFWGLLRTSRSGSVDSYWVNKRHLNPIGWMLHALGLMIFVALVAGVLARLWTNVLIRIIPSETTFIRADVLGSMRASYVTPFCRYYVDVRWDSGKPMTLCEERGLISRSITAGAVDLRIGEAVNVQLKSTVLGTTGEVSQQ